MRPHETRLLHGGEEFYFDGKSYFDALIGEFEKAKTSIDLETYIFQLDRTGRRVVHALSNAARRGVRVRLLVDGFGSWGAVGPLSRVLSHSGVQFRVFRRILFDRSLFARNAWHNLTRRNHRKTCVIDGKSAWIGSFNVSHVHTRRGGAWRDSAIHIQNTRFLALKEAFERAWEGSHRRPHPFGRLSHVLLNCTSALRKRRNAALIARLRLARKRIWVTTPYFSPGHHILSTLRRAARAGIDVRVLLPEEPDIPGVRWVNSSFYKRLHRTGLRVYLYRSRVLHAKTILTDDWAIIGSSNLNHRSWLHDLEVDAIVTDPASLEELRSQFLRDLRHSKHIVVNDPKRDGLLVKALEHSAHFIRRWT